MGTRIIDCCLWRSGLSGSFFPMKIAILQRGSVALVVYHLRPLTTYSSPSRTIVEAMLVASRDATSGSVMAKHERIFPASNGFNHFS